MKYRKCVDCRTHKLLSAFYFNKSLCYHERFCLKCRYKRYASFQKRWTSVHGVQATKKYRKTHPWYSHFCALKQRCEYPKHVRYRCYGGRGIKVLLTLADIKKLWLRDKACRMKQPSIDRVDTNQHYAFSNCQFIELSENIKKKWREYRTHVPRIFHKSNKG